MCAVMEASYAAYHCQQQEQAHLVRKSLAAFLAGKKMSNQLKEILCFGIQYG